ncbi:polymorphic toxin-type HINT domain-containing protein [Streptomyces sp. HUAS TT7]|uniref:polymorphic toxin-type HINT domain-containing protein n=1 Tax=Streptomyces sp. HUAS TT7 TaxID=3447507 RepID=UPI003F65D40C
MGLRGVSVDPVLDPTNPQSVNGYAYSNNTPVTSSDPTGLMQMCGEGGAACYPDDWNTDGTANTDGNRATTDDKPKPKPTYVSKPKPKKHHHWWQKAVDWAADHVVEIAVTVVVVSVVVGCIAATAGACAGVLVAAASGFTAGAELGVTAAVAGAAVGAGAEALSVLGVGAAVVAGAAKVAKAAKGGAGKAGGEGEAAAAAAKSEGGAAGKQEPASSPGCDSFPAPTTVLLASGAAIPIDQVKVGDTVQATDPLTNTTKPEKVTHVEVTLTDKDFTDTKVHTTTGDQTITSTQHHPYWDATGKQWVDAADLKPGEQLRQPDGTLTTVVNVRNYHRAVTTYNLTVDHIHTYYVLAGATPILVHNCGETDVTTVYRKQDTSIPETQRLSVDADGNVSHSGSGSLYLNMTGDIGHSLGFKGDQLVAFDVPAPFVRQLSEASLPQRMPRGWPGTKREWNRALKMAPDQSDESGLFGLRDHHIPGLMDAIIPGSGRIIG